ncbi:MAG: hypothetical protein ACD_75C01151G0001, partial [uncultured bacterium]
MPKPRRIVEAIGAQDPNQQRPRFLAAKLIEQMNGLLQFFLFIACVDTRGGEEGIQQPLRCRQGQRNIAVGRFRRFRGLVDDLRYGRQGEEGA